MPVPQVSSSLERRLGPVSLLMMGIGSVVGAGIYVLPGLAAAEYAGPAVSLAFVLAAVSCGFTGLCYAELAAAVPAAMGGAYGYARQVFGLKAAWWVGWMLMLEYALAGSAIAVGLTGYLGGFLEGFCLHLPDSLTRSWIDRTAQGFVVGAHLNIVAFLLVALFGIVLSRGVTQAAWANALLVMLKLGVLLLFVGVGVTHIDPALWHPFLPPAESPFHFGWLGLLRAVAVVSFAYLGFDSISIAASEARNPARDVPFGLLGALAVSAVLYVAVSLVMTGLVPYRALDVANPISLAVKALGYPAFSLILQFGALMGLGSVLLVSLYGQSRICFAMASDGLMPARMGQVSARNGAPVASVIIIASSTALAAALLPIAMLADLVSVGTMVGFIAIAFAVMQQRGLSSVPAARFRAPGPGWHVKGLWLGLVPMFAILTSMINLATVTSDLVVQFRHGQWTPLVFLLLYIGVGWFFGRGIKAGSSRAVDFAS